MTYRVYFLSVLRPGVDASDYEAWVRSVDYPVARGCDAITRYDVTRIEGTLDSNATPSIGYLEVIDVSSLEEYRSAGETPEFQKLLEEWATFVELKEAVHGPVID